MRQIREEPPKRRLLSFSSLFFIFVPPLLAVAATVGWFFLQDVDRTLTAKFDGRRWDFPSKVYSAAYPLYPGIRFDKGAATDRLIRLGYRRVQHTPSARGEYRQFDFPPAIEVKLKTFQYPTYRENGRLVRIDIDGAGRVRSLSDLDSGEPLFEVLLEPVLITGLHGEIQEDRREMRLEEVPVPLVRSIITIEDRRFFEHFGIDLRGLARAMVVNLRAGSVRQGGSTLTQQLMKNFFLTDERTFTRKIKEAVMALVAERRYEKTTILEGYLNEIYLGQRGPVGVHGIWEAAKFYFGREPRELTMGQIATLAGMIRAPNYYSPHTQPERAKTRRDVVLKALLAVGEIDERTYSAAIAEPLGVVAPPPATRGSPYFVDYVRAELAGKFPEEVLTSEGYAIHTTLDPELQRHLEGAVAGGLAKLETDYPALLGEGDRQLEAGAVAINPRTGALLAMVGGRDYRKSQFNRVTQARRQPGSVFKPIVYLTAMSSEYPGKAHFAPSSVVEDEQFEWIYGPNDEKNWSPANYEDEYFGPVTVRSALERSLNAATARIARSVGIRPVRDMAVRLGMNPKLPALPAIALGSWEVTPMEIARVYGVFASGGLRTEAISIAKVVSREGTLIEGHRVGIKRAVSQADAYLVTSLLQGVVARGTARRLRALGFLHPAAGKTGTTNDYNDAWFAGYTPDLLTVVWVGFDKGKKVGLTGSQAALPIWAEFMKKALAGSEVRKFEVPSGVVFVDVDPETGLVAHRGCPGAVREAFLKTDPQPEPCRVH